MKLLSLLPSASLIPILMMASSLNAASTAGSQTNVLTWPNSLIMTPVTLQSLHSITITSDKPGLTMFYFKITLCPLDQMGRCIEFKDHVSLSPGQIYNYSRQLTGSVIFQAPGDHAVRATTEVTGGAYSYTEDTKNLWVHY